MTMSKNWLIKLKNPLNQYQICVYEDGRVYANERNQKICLLTDSAIAEIRALIDEDLGIIKNYGYHVQDNDGYIARFWDSSNKKRNLKVKGWRGALEVRRIIFRTSNFKRLFITEDELIAIAELFFAISSKECSDDEE